LEKILNFGIEGDIKESNSYIIQLAEKPFCKNCNNNVFLLCLRDEIIKGKIFYICWNCKPVSITGEGPVKILEES